MPSPIAQKSVLAAVMDEIMASAEDGLADMTPEQVVGVLMEHVEAHVSVLRDLGNIAKAFNARNPLFDMGLQAYRVQ